MNIQCNIEVNAASHEWNKQDFGPFLKTFV